MKSKSARCDQVKLVLVSLSLSLVGFVMAGCTKSDSPSAPLNAIVASPTEVTTPMASPTTGIENLPPDQEMARRMQVREATRIAVLTDIPQVTRGPDWNPTPITWSTAMPLPAGILRPAGLGKILEDGQAGGGYTVMNFFLNQWQADLNGQEIHVYAGCDKLEVTQGVLAVDIRAANQAPISDVYKSPTHSGCLRVVGAIGQQLLLASKDNTMFAFDVALRQWISAPTTLLSRLAGSGTIHEDGQSNLPAGTGVFNNQWYKQVSTQTITVYAGAQTNDDSQGLVVLTVTAPGQSRTIESYNTPERVGSVRVVDAFGDQLVVTSERRLFIFDVTTRQWVNP